MNVDELKGRKKALENEFANLANESQGIITRQKQIEQRAAEIRGQVSEISGFISSLEAKKAPSNNKKKDKPKIEAVK